MTDVRRGAKMKFPKGYLEDLEKLKAAFQEWIAIQSETRTVDLRWHEWGKIVFAGPLTGAALDVLCASPDARAMCEWADERTGRKCTLLMAIAAAETLGLIGSGAVGLTQFIPSTAGKKDE